MISVVMSTYNDEKYIGKTIESILNQTFQDFEFIIINDGSTDNTLKIIHNYAAQDDRIVIIDKENEERCIARNTGIKVAKYPWIAAMDADDIALPNRFEVQLRYAEKYPSVVVWGSYVKLIDGNGLIKNIEKHSPNSIEEFYAFDRFEKPIEIYNSAALFRKDIAAKVGYYNEKLVSVEDIALWNRMADYGPVVIIPEVLLNYRVHSANNSIRDFFNQKMKAGYVTARYRADQQGHSISVEEYIWQYQNAPILRRFTRYMMHRSQLHYRNASLALNNRNYFKACFLIAQALIFHPVWASKRLLYRITHRKTADSYWEGF